MCGGPRRFFAFILTETPLRPCFDGWRKSRMSRFVRALVLQDPIPSFRRTPESRLDAGSDRHHGSGPGKRSASQTLEQLPQYRRRKPMSAVAATPKTARTAARPVKGAEILVEYLIKEKVPYIFGVCGHGNVGFLDAALAA